MFRLSHPTMFSKQCGSSSSTVEESALANRSRLNDTVPLFLTRADILKQSSGISVVAKLNRHSEANSRELLSTRRTETSRSRRSSSTRSSFLQRRCHAFNWITKSGDCSRHEPMGGNGIRLWVTLYHVKRSIFLKERRGGCWSPIQKPWTRSWGHHCCL